MEKRIEMEEKFVLKIIILAKYLFVESKISLDAVFIIQIFFS